MSTTTCLTIWLVSLIMLSLIKLEQMGYEAIFVTNLRPLLLHTTDHERPLERTKVLVGANKNGLPSFAVNVANKNGNPRGG
jgi:hypothetical protein